MRRTLDLLGWTSVVLTIISLILTLLTTYSIGYIEYFNTYYTLQLCIFFTMIFWAIKLYSIDTGKDRIVYPVVCLFFAVCSIFFMFMKVF
jgi:hypothetical protein